MMASTGTWARTEQDLLTALATIRDGDQPRFAEGRTLHPGYIPQEQTAFPALAYTLVAPLQVDTVAPSGNRAVFSFQLALFGETRAELIELVDSVLGALREGKFRSEVASPEVKGPGESQQIILLAERR